MNTEEIDSQALGECLLALLKEQPELIKSIGELEPGMLLHEAAAQSALLSVMSKEPLAIAGLPAPVRMLMAAFLGQFLEDLAGPLIREKWTVPQALSTPDRARFAIAQMLRENPRQPTQTH